MILIQIIYLRFYQKILSQSLVKLYINLQNTGISEYEFKQHLSELYELYNYKTLLVKKGYKQNFRITKELQEIQNKYSFIFNRKLNLWTIGESIERFKLV